MHKQYKIIFPNGYVKPELEYRDRWCRSLESGIYAQATECLAMESPAVEGMKGVVSMCCLGVLCDMSHLDYVLHNSNRFYCGSEDVISHDSPLFDSIGKLGQFPTGVTVYINGAYIESDHKNLAACNDNRLTFQQIADIIRKVWAQPQY